MVVVFTVDIRGLCVRKEFSYRLFFQMPRYKQATFIKQIYDNSVITVSAITETPKYLFAFDQVILHGCQDVFPIFKSCVIQILFRVGFQRWECPVVKKRAFDTFHLSRTKIEKFSKQRG